MVFINLIITTHMNMTTNWPLVSSMAAGRYKSANAMNPREGYWEPYAITTQIFEHKNGHYIRPNKVIQKYLTFKKDANPMLMLKCSIVHAKTFEKHIINVFSYML
jgi:hypothetical protein